MQNKKWSDGVQSPPESTGPKCSSCSGTEYIIVREMARGVSTAECKKCGETQYIPTPKRSAL